jgi:hypothetical protein
MIVATYEHLILLEGSSHGHAEVVQEIPSLLSIPGGGGPSGERSPSRASRPLIGASVGRAGRNSQSDPAFWRLGATKVTPGLCGEERLAEIRIFSSIPSGSDANCGLTAEPGNLRW